MGVAVPAITDDFQSFDDISWYQAAFTLTNCVFQLPMGKIYVSRCRYLHLVHANVPYL